MIAERVHHARAYHGWSQEHLAKLIGKSQPAISQIEKGAPAADETIAAIAEQTQFGPEFFLRGPLPDLPMGSLRFRKRASSTKRDDERIRAHVRQTLEVLEGLWPRAPKLPVRLEPVPADAVVDVDFIESLAVNVREYLGVGPHDPIPNLTRAVERAGVVVIGSSQEIGTHEGASYWPGNPIGRPIICLSREKPGDRNRLSLGHEFGHLLLHQLRQIDSGASEQEAYRFAGALLIPREVLHDQIEGPVTLHDLALVKSRFGIAVSALVRRCLDLGLISPERRTSLEKQISARGWRKEEPVHVPTEHPELVRELLISAMGTDNPIRLHRTLALPPLAIRDMVA